MYASPSSQSSSLCIANERGLKNAFMTCLPGLDIYSLLVVDLLHEVELGVWKALFIHIIRILQFHSSGAVASLDER